MPNNLLFIDIETAPDYSRHHLFGLPQPPESIPAPATLLADFVPTIEQWLDSYASCLAADYLDSLVASEAIGKNRGDVFRAIEKARESAARQRTELSTTPEFCRVVALGWAWGDGKPEAEVVERPNDEHCALEIFWSLVVGRKPTLVGF